MGVVRNFNEKYFLLIMKYSNRDRILDIINKMHYGHYLKFDYQTIYKAFPPPLRPSLLEVVADIEKALNTTREEFQSSLLSDDTPKTSLDILQKELGDEFVVQQDLNPRVCVVFRPVENCPHCHGNGYINVKSLGVGM